jgi:hypothetical protein
MKEFFEQETKITEILQRLQKTTKNILQKPKPPQLNQQLVSNSTNKYVEIFLLFGID